MDVEFRGRPPIARDRPDRVEHGQMPARARRLIGDICALCDQWVDPTLRHCLDRFDKRLYEQAESSRNHLEQQRCFDSRNLIQQQSAGFIQSFASRLREAFEQMGTSDDEQTSHQLTLQSLSLLDRNEQELTSALEKHAARIEAHNGPVLSELSYRLAVLVGAPPLEGKHLPPGPLSLAYILRDASEAMNLPLEHRLLLLQVFETSVGDAILRLYDGINEKLIADGILPQLRAFPAARPVHGPAHGAAPAAAQTPATQTPTPAQPTEQRSEPIAVLETLRDLLSRQRVTAAGPAPVYSGRTATPDELQGALSALQQHMIQVTDNTSRELRSAQRLHEELLLQLNSGVPAGAPRMQLSTEQGDTVELVAMLFEQLAQQLHHGPNARALLGNLELPLLRMAIADRDFFNQREHPARQVLGKLAETVNDWLDGPDGETDPQLLGKLSHLIERTQQEPPTAGLYTSLLADIEHHLSQLSRKAQATERRHVEAMQGRERLEQARRRADELMRERFAVSSPRGLLRTLLERAWTDVLALNLLRHGEHSDGFRQQLRITDQLLGQFPVTDTVLLRHEVETGLQQIGMNADESEQVAQRLIGPEPTAHVTPSIATLEDAPSDTAVSQTTSEIAPESEKPVPTESAAPIIVPAKPRPSTASAMADPPSATDLALRLKQRQRLGEHRGQEAPVATNAAVVPPLGLREARIHNRLRQLPFGSWFEFIDPVTNEATQRKLAWFSPVSGNSLFVTRRGQRSDMMNLQELARAIANGRVRELPPQQENLLDRAWHSLTASLLRPSPSSLPELRS
ncbi:DUF1631 family protein [Dyella sp.]|uniref:DUF1631 family protein n=1 Tax=Dyella sp. TaxID=1869338 RepID=UPI002CAD293A|nr:DUF1631 family protein [Dyella sp.]HTC26869.1 DUF1631 family protein [Dyella sp.]